MPCDEDWAAVGYRGVTVSQFGPSHSTNTDRAYAATVGELTDRRARKKAQTRELIRSVAQRSSASAASTP